MKKVWIARDADNSIVNVFRRVKGKKTRRSIRSYLRDKYPNDSTQISTLKEKGEVRFMAGDKLLLTVSRHPISAT